MSEKLKYQLRLTKPLVGGLIVAQMVRYDTDPAHSPHRRQGRNE
jgi:hypothetical protein